MSGTSVGGGLKDLPASITFVDISGTDVRGELKDLNVSRVAFFNISISQCPITDSTTFRTLVLLSRMLLRGSQSLLRALPVRVKKTSP